MATAAVSKIPEPLSEAFLACQLTWNQNPPLYLHVTSTSKRGLEMAVEKIQRPRDRVIDGTHANASGKANGRFLDKSFSMDVTSKKEAKIAHFTTALPSAGLG